MSAEDNLSRQFDKPAVKPKQKRTMAYQYDESGVTYCPSCHKHALSRNPDYFEGEKPTVKFNTDYSQGDLETCSGGCGRTIYGRKGTY